MKYNYRRNGQDITIFIVFTVLAMVATPILEFMRVSFPQRLFILLGIVYIPFIVVEWFRLKDITYTIALSLLAVFGMPIVYHFVRSVSSGVNFTVFVFAALFLLINIVLIVYFVRRYNQSENNNLLNSISNAEVSSIEDFFQLGKTFSLSNSHIFKITDIENLESKILANRDVTYDIESVNQLSNDMVLISLNSASKKALALVNKPKEQVQILVFPNIKSAQHQTEVMRILKEIKMKS